MRRNHRSILAKLLSIRVDSLLVFSENELAKNTITFTLRALPYQAFPGKGKFSIAQLWITVYIIYRDENMKSPVLRLLYIML